MPFVFDYVLFYFCACVRDFRLLSMRDLQFGSLAVALLPPAVALLPPAVALLPLAVGLPSPWLYKPPFVVY